MITQEELFKIGHFAKPHGIKGELSLMTRCDVFDESDDPYIVCEMNGILVPFFIESYRYKGASTILVKLEGVDTEADAREFTGKEVFYALDEVDEDTLLGDISWDNFVGYRVIDERHGELGPITAVDESTANVLLQIEHNSRDVLLPAVEELIKEADHEARVLRVSVPEGLLEL